MISDAVQILAGQFAHEIGIECADLLQSQTNVSGLGEFQQFGRRKVRSWTSFDQRRVNLNQRISIRFYLI